SRSRADLHPRNPKQKCGRACSARTTTPKNPQEQVVSKRSKSLRAADAKVDREKLYAPLEAVRLAKETSTTKFDGTVEVAFRLGVDPRKADQMVRGTVNLP